jgi:hypothetical protein
LYLDDRADDHFVYQADDLGCCRSGVRTRRHVHRAVLQPFAESGEPRNAGRADFSDCRVAERMQPESGVGSITGSPEAVP